MSKAYVFVVIDNSTDQRYAQRLSPEMVSELNFPDQRSQRKRQMKAFGRPGS
jgi:hypothetical protein